MLKKGENASANFVAQQWHLQIDLQV